MLVMFGCGGACVDAWRSGCVELRWVEGTWPARRKVEIGEVLETEAGGCVRECDGVFGSGRLGRAVQGVGSAGGTRAVWPEGGIEVAQRSL